MQTNNCNVCIFQGRNTNGCVRNHIALLVHFVAMMLLAVFEGVQNIQNEQYKQKNEQNEQNKHMTLCFLKKQ